MNTRAFVLAMGWFAVLVAIVLFGHGWVRASFGDLCVVPWVIACLGTPSRLTPFVKSRVAAGLGLAFVLELVQLLDLVAPDAPLILHLVFGSTFDVWDLVHYVVGAAVALGLETVVHRPRGA